LRGEAGGVVQTCGACGWESPKAVERCPRCGSSDNGIDTESPTLAASNEPSEAPTEVLVRQGGDRALDLLSPGHHFGNRYRIIRTLGAGGMGAVYQAWDDELQIAVALKVIRPDSIQNPHRARELEERFKRELLLARQVTHKNVVRIYDIGEIEGIKYITMSYVHGSDLKTLVDTESKLPVERALPLARQIAAGLAAAHEAEVIHRDLKPGNIMISSGGEAEIMDFGLARSANHDSEAGAARVHLEGRDSHASARELGHTAYGAVVGTAYYMAPEQAKGREVDERADVYAFGLILREMLLGFERLPSSKILERREGPPRPLREIDPSIPEGLDLVVQRCLQPDPDDRYRSAVEVVAALDGLDDHGRKLPRYRTMGPWSLAATVGLVVTLVAGSWEISRRLSTPPVEPKPVPVLVADFDNLSGDPVLGGSVEEAMTISLGQSRFIDPYSRTAAHDIVERISPESALTPAMARLVSQREGIKVVVTGEVKAEKGGFRIDVRALDAAADPDARPLASVSRWAASRDDVLDAVGRLAGQVRDALGDAGTTPTSQDAETFTAGSLQAMGAYAEAQELNYEGRHEEAIEHFQEAVRFDPDFGRAYAGMGAAYHALGLHDQAEVSYREALKHLDRMTEREKYRTLGGYYLGVARNYEKAIENFETLVQLYPADNTGHANLALASLYVRDLDRAVSEGREAIEIYPNNLLQRTNYAMYCMYAGRFETAIEEASRVLKAAPDEYAMLTLALSRVGGGDLDGAREAYSRLESTGGFGASVAAMGEADLEMYLGRPRKAASILERARSQDEKDDRDANLAQKLVALAEARLAVGEEGPAVQAAKDAISLSRHEGVLYPAGRVLLRAGGDDVDEVATQLENELQSQTRAYAGLLRGEWAQREGRVAEAIDAFRASLERNDTWFGRFVLAKAYLAAGHHAEALAELELCLKRRGETSDVFIADSPTVRYFPPVHYWLGRSREEVGALAAARESYDAYLALREDPDAPDPLADDASRRLATLNRAADAASSR
jgi:serine/threonine protein kinase/tetratricopeptide (TPR) repeat protein